MTNKMIVLFTLLGLSLRGTHAIVGYDCRDPDTSMSKISLRGVRPCSSHRINVTERRVSGQLVQKARFFNMETFSCLLEVIESRRGCGARGWTYDINHGEDAWVETVSFRECQDMIRDKTYRFQSSTASLIVNGTTSADFIVAGSLDNEGSCSKGDYTAARGGYIFKDVIVKRHIRFTLRTGMATMDTQENTVHLHGGVKCAARDETCISPFFGHTFWSYYKLSDCDKKNYVVIYEGVGTLITAPSVDNSMVSRTIFVAKTATQTIGIELDKLGVTCNQVTRETEHAVIFVVLKDDNMNAPFVFTERITNSLDIHMDTMDKAKSLFLYRDLQTQMVSMYNDLMYERCLTNTRIISNMLSDALNHPTNFAFDYGGQPGYHAEVKGEIIYIFKCTPVSVRRMVIKEKCYQELPVNHQNKTKFLTPRNHIIIETGRLTQCSSLMPVQFYIDGEWMHTHPISIAQADPTELDPNSKGGWKFVSQEKALQKYMYENELVLDREQRTIFNSEIDATKENFAQAAMGVPHGREDIDVGWIAHSDSFVEGMSGILPGLKSFGTFIFNSLIVIGAVMVAWTLTWFFASVIIDAIRIHRSMGFGWHMLCAISSSMVNYILATHHRDIMNSMAEEIGKHRDELENIQVTPHGKIYAPLRMPIM